MEENYVFISNLFYTSSVKKVYDLCLRKTWRSFKIIISLGLNTLPPEVIPLLEAFLECAFGSRLCFLMSQSH